MVVTIENQDEVIWWLLSEENGFNNIFRVINGFSSGSLFDLVGVDLFVLMS